MSRFSVVLIFIMSLFLLAGCAPIDPNKPKPPLVSPEGLASIGETRQIEYVQHLKDNQYQIAYKDSDNHLEWINFGGYSSKGSIIIVDLDAKNAFIKRLPDHKYNTFGLESLEDEYELHLPNEYPVGGGEYNAGTSKSPNMVQPQTIYPHK